MNSQTRIEGNVGTSTLSSFYSSIYGWMTAGMAVSALTAYVTLTTTQGNATLAALANLGFALPLLYLGIVFGIQRIALSIPPEVGRIVFLAFAAFNGVLLSTLAYAYTGASIATAFFATGVMFAGLSLYGRTTQKDLSGWGPAIFIGMIGAIIAGLANYFIGNDMLSIVVSAVVVVVFSASIAYDNQRYKSIYNAYAGDEKALKQHAILGAIVMFISFIAVFQNLLHLFGVMGDE